MLLLVQEEVGFHCLIIHARQAREPWTLDRETSVAQRGAPVDDVDGAVAELLRPLAEHLGEHNREGLGNHLRPPEDEQFGSFYVALDQAGKDTRLSKVLVLGQPSQSELLTNVLEGHVKLLTVFEKPSAIVVTGLQPKARRRDVSGAFLGMAL